MIPPPTPIVISELNSLELGMNVGTEVDDWGSLPFARVTKTGDLEEPNRVEAAPLFQCEVWAVDEVGAEGLAHSIAHAWWQYGAHVVTTGQGLSALVLARWVEVAPYPLPDPDGTAYSRFVLSLGIRLSGVE